MLVNVPHLTRIVVVFLILIKTDTVSKFDMRLDSNLSTRQELEKLRKQFNSQKIRLQQLEKENLQYKIVFSLLDSKQGLFDEKSLTDLSKISKIIDNCKKSKIEFDKLDLFVRQKSFEFWQDKDQQEYIRLQEQVNLRLKSFETKKGENKAVEARVVKINKNLSSILINQGADAKVVIDSQWVVLDGDNKVVARFVVDIVEKDISLASLIEGNINDVNQGFLIKRVKGK